MPSLVEVERVQDFPSTVTLEVGDLLRVAATGGRVEEGASLAFLGAFRTGYLPLSGRLILHSGVPNAVFFRAVEQGRARISLFSGEPYHQPVATVAEIDVLPAGTSR